MKIKLLISLGSMLVLVFTVGTAAAQAQYTSGNIGVDVGYPNCSASIPNVSFGIVAVTGGLGFHPNPCLKTEAANFKNLSFYVSAGYPGKSYGLKYNGSPKSCTSSDLDCLAYDYGYNAGLYAVNYAKSSEVHSLTWWLDVETINSWTNDPAQNQNSLQGEHAALMAAGATTVGVYSTTDQWDSLTGSWLNKWPSWGATTWTTAKQAATYCTGHEFTGGPSYLMQYLGSTLDHDYAC